MEALVFHGEDVEGWIRGIEMYFKVHYISDEDWIEVIMANLEGLALQWFVWTTNQYILED